MRQTLGDLGHTLGSPSCSRRIHGDLEVEDAAEKECEDRKVRLFPFKNVRGGFGSDGCHLFLGLVLLLSASRTADLERAQAGITGVANPNTLPMPAPPRRTATTTERTEPNDAEEKGYAGYVYLYRIV